MQKLEFEDLKNFIKNNSNKKTLISFHSIGDTDSIASAFGISLLFKNSVIATPDFITSNSLSILKKLNYPTIKNLFDETAELIILLDLNDFGEYGESKEKLETFKNSILIIDHHFPKEIKKDNLFVFDDENYSSTTSIVYKLLNEFNVQIDKNLAMLLALGIISDSAEFKNSNADTFIQIGNLLKIIKIDYPSLLDEFMHISDVKERARTIKEILESTLILKNNILFLFGDTKAHANIAADNAIKIGADIALFYSVSNKEISFSARLRPVLDKELNINLGQIMKSIAYVIHGNGGGHPCAAGAYGSLQFKKDEFINIFIQKILNKIETNKKITKEKLVE
ncbi:MAG: DHH family phosphoesterase [Candidatus Marsarchaeota archaeon]|nr:DHH family phosphoesterase [Candidatus Marsarchaeota archaeon]MCL5094383.1 DHH family phosphoesterase [Candidatus Marsarchaeota archaeon]